MRDKQQFEADLLKPLRDMKANRAMRATHIGKEKP